MDKHIILTQMSIFLGNLLYNILEAGDIYCQKNIYIQGRIADTLFIIYDYKITTTIHYNNTAFIYEISDKYKFNVID